MLVSICNYCCPSYFCLLSPLLLTVRVPLARRSAGKKFSQIWARPALGSDPRHSFWLSESRSIAYHSGRIVALKNTFARLVRVACVGSCMYVHTNIHTYIHTYMYIFIYRYIFGYLFSFGPGTKETRITLFVSLSFFFLYLSEEKFRDFEKWKKVTRFVQILKDLENSRSQKTFCFCVSFGHDLIFLLIFYWRGGGLCFVACRHAMCNHHREISLSLSLSLSHTHTYTFFLSFFHTVLRAFFHLHSLYVYLEFDNFV